jgi:hypothetical protein
MNVILVMREVLATSNPVIGESALPNFPLSAEHCTQGM